MYCSSYTNYNRLKVRTVNIGNIPIGNDYPVRIQTMTNTDTQNIEDTTSQIVRSFEKGADYVRITTPTLKDVDAMHDIISNLCFKGIDKPIIADVHFNKKVALTACTIASKVRINPGNLVDTNKRDKVDYTEKEYNEELKKIDDVCKKLAEVCESNNTALRIGTNHGSLSYRIIGKYGNTVEGLVEATIEYLDIFSKYNFHNIVISIKSSNPTVMVHANRYLVKKMIERNAVYPIHIGVTEAGNMRDGRIKSAVGIGALMIDGIGDTIRVSLTEKPENELPVAFSITNYVEKRKNAEVLPEINTQIFNPYSFEKRKTYNIKNIGGNKPPVVIADSTSSRIKYCDFKPDYIIANTFNQGDLFLEDIPIISYVKYNEITKTIPLLDCSNYLKIKDKLELVFVEATIDTLSKKLFDKIKKEQNVVFIAKAKTNNIIGEFRQFFEYLQKNKNESPVILKLNYNEPDSVEFAIKASIDTGVFFIDGLADGLILTNKGFEDLSNVTDTCFDILQATNSRLSKTEFISCPSCGRTLFDIEKVSEKIKEKTSHLKGLKIAIMGCIVNGPGEVADADYGFIGSGKNLITLFKGKTPVKKNINQELAVEELINLIKENGDWVDYI